MPFKARFSVPSPSKVYSLLLKQFGPQGWWPVTPPGCQKPHYLPNRYARTERQQFEICVGALLTQNTAWANVEKALRNLQAAGLVDASKLKCVHKEKVAELIRPSGYFNQKAERLKVLAGFFSSRGVREFFSLSVKDQRAGLLALKGIGPETADSIILYAGNKRSFVIDAYTIRVGERYGWFSGLNYEQAKEFFERRLPSSTKCYNEFHALLVRLCKEFCRKKPRCAACPLSARCKGKKKARGTDIRLMR